MSPLIRREARPRRPRFPVTGVLRAGVLGLLLVLLVPGVAEAGRGVVVFNYGTDVIHVRDLPPEVATETSFTQVGYRYDLVGVYWIDLWRSGGEFVLFSGEGRYTPISDAEAADLGASVPWRYHLPPGLLVLLGALELALMIWRRPSVRTTTIIGGALVVTAGVLFLKDVGPTLLIPGLLGLYHLLGAWTTYRLPMSDDVEPPAQEERGPTERPHAVRPSPPTVETDPFRAPPRPAPLRIERPATAPSAAPVVHDPGAEVPKLLR